MKTYETTTTAGTLAGMFQFTAAKDPRTYLQGVHVCTAPNGGPMFAATDGHLFGAMPGNPNDAGPVDAFTIPNDLLKQIKTTPRNGGDVVRIRVEWATESGAQVSITLEHNGATYTQGATVHPWPDFWRIVPRTVSGAPGQIAPPLLSRFIKATGFLQGRPANGYELHVFHNGETGAARVAILPVPDFVGVVMPYQNKKAPALALPEWATDKTQAQKAA